MTGLMKKMSPKMGEFGIALGFLYDGRPYYFLQNEFALSPNFKIKPSIGFLSDDKNKKQFNTALSLRYNLQRNK